jgi:hypothetical protein
MILINEWLPNPAGNEAKGEFVELFNNGDTAANISGWALKASGKKIYFLRGRTQSIAPHGYLLLKRSDTKLALKNSNETLLLYDATGHLADQSSFLGQAASGKSFSRVYYPNSSGSSATVDSLNALAIPQSFAWGMPTPGAANKLDLHNTIAATVYPFDTPLNHAALSGGEFIEMILGVGAILAALVVYCLKSDELISQLFFKADK